MGVVVRLATGKAIAFRDVDSYEVVDKSGSLSLVRWAPQGGTYSVGLIAAGSWQVVTVIHPSDEQTMKAAVGTMSDEQPASTVQLGSPAPATYAAPPAPPAPPPPPPPAPAATLGAAPWSGPGGPTGQVPPQQ